MTSQSGGGESRTQIWDVRNRLSSASVTKNSVTTNASYLYTSDGIRSSVTENGSKIDYIIDSMTPSGYAQVVEELASGVLVARFTYGASLDPISMNKDTNGSPATLETSLFTGDGHSGVRQAIDIAGAILLSQRFDAFGVKVANTGTLQTPIGYRGERFDTTLGQYYLRARYYDPRSGRFNAMDPYSGNLGDPLQINRYGYAGMNPIGNSDPSGKMSTSQIVVGIGIIGLLGLLSLSLISKFNNRNTVRYNTVTIEINYYLTKSSITEATKKEYTRILNDVLRRNGSSETKILYKYVPRVSKEEIAILEDSGKIGRIDDIYKVGLTDDLPFDSMGYTAINIIQVNIETIKKEANKFGITYDRAYGITLAHEIGHHAIANETAHRTETGFIDSEFGDSGVNARFSDVVGYKIAYNLFLKLRNKE